MSLFSKKEICSICNQNADIKKLSDGVICKNCISKCNPFLFAFNWKDISSDTVREAISESAKNEELCKTFTVTKKIDKFFELDEKNQLWKVPRTFPTMIFSYNDILNFELLENGNAISKGGLGSTVVGGVLFGGVGAIVGSVVGSKKTKQEISEYRIKIIVKKPFISEVYINFLETGKVKSGGILYNSYSVSAQKILSTLALMVDFIKNSDTTYNPANTSAADEISKFKSLLDQGAISQEEFDIKKKQLLGL